MDILNLVNKLEELFSQGRSLPFTHNVVINALHSVTGFWRRRKTNMTA